MAQLNYMAIMCDDPVEMQEWYARWFGFEEMNRTGDGTVYMTDGDGTVYMTDGYFNVGLLKRGSSSEDEQKRGLHHFGFQIDSIAEIERNLEDFDPSIRIEQRPSEDPYAQYRIRDTEGIILDLSESGFGTVGQPRVPGIRHLALFNRNVARKFDFYQEIMGMRDATRSDEEIHQQFAQTTGRTTSDTPLTTSPFCGDGFVNVAMLGRNMTEETGAGKWGFNHFGILVRDPLDVVRRMGQLDGDRPADVRPPERQVEYGVQDPEGNRIDVSGKKGWKVDVDKWARIDD